MDHGANQVHYATVPLQTLERAWQLQVMILILHFLCFVKISLGKSQSHPEMGSGLGYLFS